VDGAAGEEWSKMPEKEKTPFYLYRGDGTATRNHPPTSSTNATHDDTNSDSLTSRSGSVDLGTVNPLDYTAVKECPRPAAAVYEAEIKTLTNALNDLRHRRCVNQLDFIYLF